MNSKILGLLSAIVLCWTVVNAGENRHGADLDDNEFAEFEEFDSEDEVENNAASKQKKVIPEKTQPEEKKPDASFEEDEDDDEEGQVQVEDDGVDEFDHFTDEEEFENYEHDTTGKKSGPKDASPGLKITKVPLHLHTSWESYYLEILMVTGLVVYFTNFIIGRMKNQKLALTWLNVHKEMLESNFSLVGDDGKNNEDSNQGIVKESESIYTLWCSGRVCCEGMLVQLKLLKRQDLISIISQFFRPTKDSINIKINLSTDCMDTFVFALAHKKTANKIGREMADLSTYCVEKKSVDKYGISGNYVMLSELGEVSSALLDSKIIAILNRFPDAVDYIHISDQFSGPKNPDEVQQTKLPDTKKVMIFNFNLPGNGRVKAEEIEGMKPLLQLVFYMIDKVKKFRLSSQGKSKSDKNRLKVEEAFLKTTHLQRQEAAQLKREERRRVEKERILNEDDPEKQRKWEERDQRRELKRKAPKMKQLKVKAL